MKVLSTVAEMQAACRELRQSGKSLGFVPTMGALHQGHLSLVRAARAHNQAVAASIFVNPLQFGPSEDFSKYPRTFDRDRQFLEAEKVDLLFAPSHEEMYPKGSSTAVYVAGLSEKLDGRSRPGHFQGVTTVVAKLFEIVRPHRAYFGQKDAAQVAVIRKMVDDLNVDIEIVVCPIVREQDGLALSSRNTYLSPEQRKQALALYRSLTRIQTFADRGERASSALIEAGKQVLADEPAVQLDYFEVVDPNTLDPVPDISRGALVAIAAWVGTTRLIDNIVLQGPGQARALNDE
ncbi:MAG TPA: pantoate--beta-alanine ligase [Terriglobales bacterium]|nr:pantoate--beta-alanine ligase [Terriglobales bacterium]